MSPQVSRTLLSILPGLNNVVIWMVSTCPLISKYSTSFINPLVIVPRALITIGINVTFMFHSFFQFPSKVDIFFLLFTFFQFYSVVSRDSKVLDFASSLFFVDYYTGLVIWPRLDDSFVSQNSIVVCVSHSPGQMLGCAYTICSYGQI